MHKLPLLAEGKSHFTQIRISEEGKSYATRVKFLSLSSQVNEETKIPVCKGFKAYHVKGGKKDSFPKTGITLGGTKNPLLLISLGAIDNPHPIIGVQFSPLIFIHPSKPLNSEIV